MTGPRPETLLERVRRDIRLRHLSRRTEKAYVGWIRRYVRFHGRRHPRELGDEQIVEFQIYSYLYVRLELRAGLSEESSQNV